MIKIPLSAPALVLASMLVLAGCSGSPATPKVLTFSDMEVTCDSRVGFFGGRYTSFKVTGSVTNDTDNPVNEDNMPSIVSEGEGEFEPRLSQDKLLSGETCDISYEGEINVDDGETPKLTFEGKLETAGLDETEKELQEKVSEKVGEFAAKDEKREREEKERQKARKAVEDCEGKTAKDALAAAEAADIKYFFLDKYDVDVTGDVEKAKYWSDILKSKVTDVELRDGFFGGATAKFTLDYVDEEAEADRKTKEEEKKAKEKAQQAVEDAEGKTAGDALDAAEAADYAHKFLDVHDVDVTDVVDKAKDESEILNSKVTSVKIDHGLFGGVTATFSLDYVDKEAEARKKAEEEKATKGASASDKAAPKEKKTGPDLEFTIVAVEHLWESDSVVPDGFVPFHIMGGVTNNTDKTVSISGLPSLYCPETGVTADLILYDNNDQTDEVDAIKPGEAMAFDYYEEVDKPYGGWVFRANSNLEVSGLAGVPEQVQGVLRQGFDELAAHKDQEAQRMQEQEQQEAEATRAKEAERQESIRSSTCWVTETGHAYHTNSRCRTIRGSTLYEMTVAEAREAGYDPCGVCTR